MTTYGGFDFTKKSKDVLLVVIGTEEEPIELSILPPTLRVHNGMKEVAKYVEMAANGDLDDASDMPDCLDLVAQAMSRNREGRVVTAKQLDAMGFDMSDVGEFVGLYLYFITKLVEAKN